MDNFYSIVGILNLHSSMFVLFLSLLMLACIRKEYRYIKSLKNGRRQLFMALVGIFIITALHSLRSIFSYFFAEYIENIMHIFGLALNVLSIGVLGSFIATKWQIILDDYAEKKNREKGKNEKSKSKR